MVNLRVAVGEVSPAISSCMYRPRVQQSDIGVIICHGTAGNTFNYSWGATSFNQTKLNWGLAREGFELVGTEVGVSWGNDTAMGRIDACMAYLNSLGLRQNKVHLLATSMGHMTATRWASLNPTKVATITGLIGCSDIENAYQNNTGGLQAGIAAAWGIAFPTPLPAAASQINTHGPIIAANDIPHRIYYSPTDATVLPATVEALLAVTGGEGIQIAGGHSDAAIGNVALPSLLEFLRQEI